MLVKFEKIKALSILIGIFLVIFIALAVFMKPETLDEKLVRLTTLRRRAYDDAIECSGIKTPELRFDQVQWITIPGNIIKIQATDGLAILKGFFNPADSVIYVVETEEDTPWLLLHESLHAIGYRGHPDHPFKTCKALPEQN